MEKLKMLRKVKGLSAQDVADAIGISASYYYNIERGIKRITEHLAVQLADYFNVSIEELTDDVANPIDDGYQRDLDSILLPIVTGFSDEEEFIDGYEPVIREWISTGEYFYFRTTDNGAANSRILKGDLLLIRRQDSISNGDLALIEVNGRLAIRRYYHFDGLINLISDEPGMQASFYRVEDSSKPKIRGRVSKNVISY